MHADEAPEEPDRPLGSFSRIFPSASPSAQARYEQVLAAAEEVFEFSILARTQKTLHRVLVRVPEVPARRLGC